MAIIAFLGLGVMGGPMARHLMRAGHEVRLFNRTAAKAQAIACEGGTVAQNPAEAAAGADACITCVGNDEDLVRALEDEAGALVTLPAGALVIDHSTTSASLARALAGRHPGWRWIDAPVSGGEAGAVEGRLSIMCGGAPDAIAAARPILGAYGRTIVRIGPSGHGQLAKMANQIAIAGIVQGLAEALSFAKSADLDCEALIAAIGQGAAQSWQLDHRARSMLDGQFDFGFAVDLMRKDLGLVLDEARRTGATLPLTALVDQFYADVQRMGGGRDDTSSLIRRLV